jgi:hypothetical protein
MSEAAARVFGTLGIWAATAVMVGLVTFREGWSGDLILLAVAVVCAAAALATAAVWAGGRRAGHSGGRAPGPP